jgi:hypothetical protein
MSTEPDSHPPAEVLRQFGLGKLTGDSLPILDHLEQCAACRERVAALSGDSFLDRMRAAAGRSVTPMPDKPVGALPPQTFLTSGTPTIPDLPPELANHPQYEIVRELGRGGMGVVYLARNRQMDRLEVLKVMGQGLLAQPGARQRFEREIRSAARLNHPNVVTAYSVLPLESLLVLAMEYVEGEDLARIVKSRGPLPVANACYYAHQAAQGLQHAHEKGMVHRDIKPQNLILDRDRKKHAVKVLDFGLAKATSEKGGQYDLTGEGKMLGTPQYVAPEQINDASTADIRADIYSLGCTLHCLLSGSPPFAGKNLLAILHAHHFEEAAPLNEVRPEVPQELAAVVRKMMAKDPAQRYQTPAEVARALVPFIKAKAGDTGEQTRAAGAATTGVWQGLDAPTLPPPAVATAAAKKRSLVIGGVLLAVVLAGLLAGVFMVKTRDGTIVLENLPADADVTVDDHTVTVTNDGKTFTVRVAANRKHRLEVKKDGFETFGEEVEVEVGGRKPVAIHLGPATTGKGESGLPTKGTVPPAGGGATTGGSVASARAGPGAAADDFVPLFNGKDLAGWKSPGSSAANWEVKDAVLCGSGGTGCLFSDGKAYENFHLRVAAMINDGGMGGVFFRAPFGQTTPQGRPSYGYEARLNITHRDPNKTGSLFLGNKVVAGVAKTPTELNEWFTFEVIADGPHVVAKVNGAVAASFIDLDFGNRSGRIALGVLDATTAVKFRKVELKELPPGDLRLQYPHDRGVFEQVKGNVWIERNGEWLGYFREHARNNVDDGGGTMRLNRKIENNQTGVLHITRGNGAWWNVQGTSRWTRIFFGNWSVLGRPPPPEKSAGVRYGEWTPLFNGKDTEGWKPAGNENTTWTYDAGALTGRSGAGPAGLLLSDRADYENFHLRLETRLAEGGHGSLFLRCGPAKDGTTGNKCYAVRIGSAAGGPAITGTLVLSAHLDEAAPLVLTTAAKVPVQPDEWFGLEVIAEGNRLRVLVKDKTVVDFKDANATFTLGRLGLVCHGNMTVRFRNMEVKDLPPAE